MIEEERSIPFTPGRLQGERILVLAPHPDDEVIGCGGALALLAVEKREIHVIVATDGSAAERSLSEEDTPAAYRARREDETRRGLAHLGVSNVAFLRLPDRTLQDSEDELISRIRSLMREIKPDLVLAPSPLEIHPDHVALSRALFRAIQGTTEDLGHLALTMVAFYEVSRPIRPNRLIDITSVAEKKFEAIALHASQTSVRDYAHFARGLNAYRAMTLPSHVKFAEAYFERSILDFRTMSWSALVNSLALEGSGAEVVASPLPVTVLIRTKNRPALLKEAVASVVANTHPARIIVVNDGGASPADILRESRNVTLIDNQASLRRSEAMNVAARAAGEGYLAFLDDDDVYYADHLEVLARATQRKTHLASYTDALSVFLERDASGELHRQKALRLYAHDFDRDLLLVENYIPLPTLMVSREDFLDSGGFDRRFDLFEDWDFLIRLSRRGSLQRIPALTCEIRHIEGIDSAVLASPEGSSRFAAAKLKIWEKHADIVSHKTFATALGSQKARLMTLQGTAVESQGLARHLERDVARLQREKELLLTELEAANADRSELRTANATLSAYEAAAKAALQEIDAEIKYQHRENARLTHDVSRLEKAVAQQSVEGTAMLAEIIRLNDLLKSIYASKAWRLHEIVQRVKGSR